MTKKIFLYLIVLFAKFSFSQSLQLTTSPQWVNVGDIDVVGNQLTVEALVYYTGGVDVVSKHTGPPNVNYLLRLSSFELTTTSGFYLMPNPYVMSPNTWYHIAGTYDGSNIRYYVNGCLVITVPATGNLITQNLATAIGNISCCSSEQFYGNIDEVRIWNVARTQAQIQGNMNNLPSPATQLGLLAYYQFSNNLINSQGNAAFDGVAVGAAPVYAPDPPIIVTPAITSLIAQDALCVNNTGTVGINAVGTNLQYSIDNTTYGSTSSFTGLATGNYTAYIKNPEGCMQQQPFTITLTPTPTITIVVTSPVPCTAGGTTLTASGATNYTWSPSATLSSSNGNIVIANPLVNTTYNVTGESSSCTNTASISVHINSTLTAVTSQTNVTCYGGNNGSASVIASGSSGSYNYSWSSTPTQTTQTANGLAAGTYSVTVTNTVCTASGNELITNGDFSSGNTSFSSGYIYTPPPNTAASQYFVSTGAQVSTWNGGMFSAGDHTSGSGNLMMVNGSGTPGTNVFCQTIAVNPNTNYNFSTWVSSLNTGLQAQLQFYVNGIPLGSVFTAPATINTWSQFFSVWNSGVNNSASICIVNQNSSLSGNDFALDDISFQECLTPCPVTQTVTITEPANFTVTITSASVCIGSSASLSASGASSYTWNASTNLSSANGSTVLATPNVTETYTVTGAIGVCTNTSVTTITVVPNPTITVSPTSSTICPGSSTTLTANGASTYTWVLSSTLSSNTGSIVTATPTTTTVYTITGTANTCTNTAITTVSVLPNPTLTLTPSFSICSGTSATLTANGANTYTWNASANLSSATGSVVIATPNAMETYTVTGELNTCTGTAVTTVSVISTPTLTANTSSAVICPQGSASLTVSGATNYTWSPSASLSASSGTLVVATPINTSTYSVIGSYSNCRDTTQVVVTVTVNPTIASTSATICSSASANLSANGGVTYTWSPATNLNTTSGANVISTPPSFITYTVSGSSPLGCIGSTSVTVNVIPTPTITISANPLTVCSGSNSALIANGATSYTWSPSSVSNINSANTIASPINTTTYLVTGTNGSAPTICTSTQTIQITVRPKIIPIVSPNDAICFGYSTKIYAIGGNTYHWSPTTGVSKPNDSTTVVKPISTTIYTVSVSINSLCPVTNTVQVTVYPLPTVNAGKDSTINIDQDIVLTGTGNVDVGFLSPDGNPLICNWCPIVTVSPKETTCYTLEGFNTYGCRNTDEVCITVTKDWDVFIPNSFTPNGDLSNEYFMPKGYGIEQIDLIIFDRWGSVIFNETNTVLGWDGKYKGIVSAQGVYVYQATVKAMSGESTVKTGYVTVLSKVK
jgi:gliding motility-associated-like protein